LYLAIKDINIRPETLKLGQKRSGNILEQIGIGNGFLNRIQMSQQRTEKIDKWDYMKLKFLQNRRNDHQIEEAASCTSDSGLMPRIYRKVKNTKLSKYQ
jgi:hypothetical protein